MDPLTQRLGLCPCGGLPALSCLVCDFYTTCGPFLYSYVNWYLLRLYFLYLLLLRYKSDEDDISCRSGNNLGKVCVFCSHLLNDLFLFFCMYIFADAGKDFN